MTTVKDMKGLIFGKLTVIERADRPINSRANKYAFWKCVCECGNEIVVRGDVLRRIQTSCKCIIFVHGDYESLEYSSWDHMIQRCTNSNNDNFDLYGGRGITVCDRWRYSFINFLEDMGRKPSTKHSIDRIDNNGNYEPSNCKWSTMRQQMRNFSGNRSDFKYCQPEE